MRAAFDLAAAILGGQPLRVALVCVTLAFAGLAVMVQLGTLMAFFFSVSMIAHETSAPYVVVGKQEGRTLGQSRIPDEVQKVLVGFNDRAIIERVDPRTFELTAGQGESTRVVLARSVALGPESLSVPTEVTSSAVDALNRPMTVVLTPYWARKAGVQAGDTLRSAAGEVEVVSIEKINAPFARALVGAQTANQVWRAEFPELDEVTGTSIILVSPRSRENLTVIQDIKEALSRFRTVDVYTPRELDRALVEDVLNQSDQLRAFIVTGSIVVAVIALIISQIIFGLISNVKAQLSLFLAIGVRRRLIVQALFILCVFVCLISIITAVGLAWVTQSVLLHWEIPMVMLPEFIPLVFAVLGIGLAFSLAAALPVVLKLDPVELLR